jgi:hypothetical protein
VPRGQYRRRVGPHSSGNAIKTLDSRTNVAKLLKRITNDLLGHLGDPTPPQRIIVNGAAFKALRIALFADRMLNEPGALSDTSGPQLVGVEQQFAPRSSGAWLRAPRAPDDRFGLLLDAQGLHPSRRRGD